MDDFYYDLPQDRIAQRPSEPRDASRLLLYRNGHITDHKFRELPELLPSGCALFFNDARVIPARILLQTAGGAGVEVFLLRPAGTEYTGALNATRSCEWECMVGNARKWKKDEILSRRAGSTDISFKRMDNRTVRMEWDDGKPFLSVLEEMGKVPLPPYITHDPDAYDTERYQTIFARSGGSVAAPTAGLHFTEAVLGRLKTLNIRQEYLTLHVSAGTFLPVKTSDAREHNMHLEFYEISREGILNLFSAGFPVAVGTTACRVMESLYWVAAGIYSGLENPLSIPPLVYETDLKEPPRERVAEILTGWMDNSGKENLSGDTSLMILPGYRFRVCKGLITNFHQPRSTLLLLISALTGKNWRQIYSHALDNGYRFLSYGDSSLLLPEKIF